MRAVDSLFSQAVSIFQNMFLYPDWRTFLDVLIVAVCIYYVLRLFVRTRASALLKGIFIVLAVTWLAEALQLNAVSWLLSQVLNTGVILLIVLFQPEMRRALEKIGRTGRWGKLFASPGKSQEEGRRIVAEMTGALMNLSRRRVGALIVVEQGTGLDDVVESGARLDSRISEPLIENIFEPNTPLHDGAVVIRGDRVEAAACILRLTEDNSLSRELGTRHRAAIGVSETTDAVVFIVSEETGIISTARDGRLTRYLDKNSLNSLLSELFEPRETALRGSVNRLFARRREDRDEQ